MTAREIFQHTFNLFLWRLAALGFFVRNAKFSLNFAIRAKSPVDYLVNLVLVFTVSTRLLGGVAKEWARSLDENPKN